MVHAVQRLTAAVGGGASPYHIHTKVVLKEPRTGGAFNCHQDFGYWYACGTLDPNSMMSVIVAVDAHDVENGCLHVLAGSQRLGRLEHGHAGEQAGADPAAVEQACARFSTVACALAPGDTLFTHSNLVHWSGPNESARWRRAIICAFNDAANPPSEKGRDLIPAPHVLDEVDDGALMALGPVGHDAATADGASWLSHAKNVDTFGRAGPDFGEGTEAFAARAAAAAAAAAVAKS